MPVLHTVNFKAFGPKLCLGRNVKLCKNATWHDLEKNVIFNLPKVVKTLNFETIWRKIRNVAIPKNQLFLKRCGVQLRKPPGDGGGGGGNPPKCARGLTLQYVFVDLTRDWPGSQPNAIDRGGTYNAPPPPANSQTNDRSETGEAALERSRRDGSKALLNFS